MNTAWNNGYQTTVNYTYGYYRDLSPNYQRFCMLLRGVDCAITDQEHTHCELGFGQGVSVNIHAASSDGLYWGTDFNPAHAAHAQKMAAQCGIKHQFFDDSFEEFLNREDLPQFDSISLHGIWSWISYENQLIILKFIRKQLKASGIVYISYNCSTGWAANMPIRELFYSHYKFNGKSNNPTQKVSDALEFSQALFDQQPLFLQRHPLAKHKLDDLKKQNPNYLLHEYLNQDWQCFSFQQIVRLFEDIKLSFAGSTDLSTLINEIHLNQEQREFIDQIEHPIFKEQCRDYFVANQFRRDLYVRGKTDLSPLEVKERLRNTHFIFLTTIDALPSTIQGVLGSFDLIHDVYVKIAQQYVKHKYRPITLKQLEESTNLSYKQLLDSLVILCHLGFAQPCLDQMPSSNTLHKCQSLNRYLVTQAKFHNNYQVLANPLTGMGLVYNQFELLTFYVYFIEKITDKNGITQRLQLIFDDLGMVLVGEENQPVADRDENMALLNKQIELLFDRQKIDIVKQLKLFA
ncbi:class I SAM-dependent methyltransferase [Acinetobacter rudis]|uniref:Class I SAM-dependent methyltransferase n=1 Tax=Acinetobacter rudis TaxID=632955 RepID=A0AAW8J8F8_9GAMM|nr:class I SAM-dependent methyltransferase [Acinetobacter rudis]MDQ8935444.1 class I SAM-dependent methyltransferase [Acinetobacter rudis]MDQ9017789.1 class I SAM-dependent methyltransferase [Acinetobacter rudis]